MGTCSPSCLSVDKVDKKTPFREEGQHRPPPEIAPGKGAIFFAKDFPQKLRKIGAIKHLRHRRHIMY